MTSLGVAVGVTIGLTINRVKWNQCLAIDVISEGIVGPSHAAYVILCTAVLKLRNFQGIHISFPGEEFAHLVLLDVTCKGFSCGVTLTPRKKQKKLKKKIRK